MNFPRIGLLCAALISQSTAIVQGAILDQTFLTPTQTMKITSPAASSSTVPSEHVDHVDNVDTHQYIDRRINGQVSSFVAPLIDGMHHRHDYLRRESVTIGGRDIPDKPDFLTHHLLRGGAQGPMSDGKSLLRALQYDVSRDPSSPKVPLKILHLGDSFSAGTGTDTYYGPKGCYRSKLNWGEVFAKSLEDIFHVSYINRACNGAVTSNLFRKKRMYDIPHFFKDLNLFPTKDPKECPEPSDDEYFENIETDRGWVCERYVKPQLESVTNEIDLVLITSGGNDLGFAFVVQYCFVPIFTTLKDCAEKIAFARKKLDNPLLFRNKIRDALLEIRKKLMENRSRGPARVILSSYPRLLPKGKAYFITQDVEGEDIPALYPAGSVIEMLAEDFDEEQRKAVAEANAKAEEDFVTYFDRTKDVFEGHEPDPDPFEENPDRWINELFEPSKIDFLTWYHPTIKGHSEWGDALSILGTAGAVGGSFEGSASIDLALVVDATGSMSDTIASVRRNLASLVNQLAAATSSYRVAVVSYQDIPPDGLYASRVDLSFTSNLSSIQEAIGNLDASEGGDTPETVFSGIKSAIDLPWRTGVTKLAIVIGDAGPKIDADGKEPVSNLTAAEIIASSIAVDPVQITFIDLNVLHDESVQQISSGTGGEIISGAGGIVSTLEGVIDTTSKQPFAWFGESIVGKVGTPVTFNAQGSYDPYGHKIDNYEWDFDGDGVFDTSSEKPFANHTYTAEFEGRAILRVHSIGGHALASALVIINEEGSVPQNPTFPCEINDRGLPIITNGNGTYIYCMAEEGSLMENVPGVTMGDNSDSSFMDSLIDSYSTHPSEWSTAQIAGVAGGVGICLLILCCLVYCCCCRRDKIGSK